MTSIATPGMSGAVTSGRRDVSFKSTGMGKEIFTSCSHNCASIRSLLSTAGLVMHTAPVSIRCRSSMTLY